MTVQEAIDQRRAYRSLESFEVTDSIVKEFARAASLAPSCYNKQPWRYVFVRDPKVLTLMHAALSKGNDWAKSASLIIAVCSKKDYDCILPGREYFLFDLGLGTAFMILRATELGFVAHPIAGFDPGVAKKVLGIPDDMTLITLVIVGKHSEKPSAALSEAQVKLEKERPKRVPLEKILHVDKFQER